MLFIYRLSIYGIVRVVLDGRRHKRVARFVRHMRQDVQGRRFPAAHPNMRLRVQEDAQAAEAHHGCPECACKLLLRLKLSLNLVWERLEEY